VKYTVISPGYTDVSGKAHPGHTEVFGSATQALEAARFVLLDQLDPVILGPDGQKLMYAELSDTAVAEGKADTQGT